MIIKNGRYGYYVNYNNKNYKFKEGLDEHLDLSQAIECIDIKDNKPGGQLKGSADSEPGDSANDERCIRRLYLLSAMNASGAKTEVMYAFGELVFVSGAIDIFDGDGVEVENLPVAVAMMR